MNITSVICNFVLTLFPFLNIILGFKRYLDVERAWWVIFFLLLVQFLLAIFLGFEIDNVYWISVLGTFIGFLLLRRLKP